MDINEITSKIVTEAMESEDEFIFTTIKPWCEEKMQRKISKRDLENALKMYFSLEQEPTTKNDLGVDCVSRQAVESLVWRYLRKATDENIAFYESFLDLPSVTPQEPTWIPVSKSLPENSGNYLITYCYVGKIEIQEAVYVIGEEDKWFDTTGIEITLAVIAWMPLPKPYKAESEE